jgi:hypothetical protein
LFTGGLSISFFIFSLPRRMGLRRRKREGFLRSIRETTLAAEWLRKPVCGGVKGYDTVTREGFSNTVRPRTSPPSSHRNWFFARVSFLSFSRFGGSLKFRRACAKPSDGFGDSPEIDQGFAGRSHNRTGGSFATVGSVVFPG